MDPLTAQERKMLEHVERQNRLWPRMRWLYLLFSAYLIVRHGWLFFRHLSIPRDLLTGPLKDVALLMLQERTLQMVGDMAWVAVGCFGLIFAIGFWRGRPVPLLLSRLLRDRERLQS